MTEQQLQILREKYEKLIEEYLNKLLELDSVPLNERVYATYTIGSLTFNWTEYKQYLINEIKSCNEVLASLQKFVPFEIKRLVI